MKLLRKKDLELVRPKFRNMVLEAWKNNEHVPYSVILLSDDPITEKEITHFKSLNLVKE